MNLKEVLNAAVESSDKGGGHALSLGAIDGLKAYRRRQFTIFVIVETALVVAICLLATYIVLHPGQTAVAKTLTGVIGVSTGGGIEVARRIWKEWARTDLILLLLAEASEAQVKGLIDRLLKLL